MPGTGLSNPIWFIDLGRIYLALYVAGSDWLALGALVKRRAERWTALVA